MIFASKIVYYSIIDASNFCVGNTFSSISTFFSIFDAKIACLIQIILAKRFDFASNNCNFAVFDEPQFIAPFLKATKTIRYWDFDAQMGLFPHTCALKAAQKHRNTTNL